jgi:hypothetical protein
MSFGGLARGMRRLFTGERLPHTTHWELGSLQIAVEFGADDRVISTTIIRFKEDVRPHRRKAALIH